MKLKKGDKVIIQLGKDRGKVSAVDRVLSKRGEILVQGINIVKKHLKPTGKTKRGGIIEIEKPINISNVMIVCPNCGKPTRVAIKITGKTKERVCKKCGGSLDRFDKATASKTIEKKEIK